MEDLLSVCSLGPATRKGKRFPRRRWWGREREWKLHLLRGNYISGILFVQNHKVGFRNL